MRHLKYERLIRACYPPGLGDKKPKPSELSYLIYYLNTHRSQIPQAAEFLERKAAKYVSKNRIGNASVTVAIMTQMIQDCKDDLNNFAPEAISIISIALDSGELGLLNCGSDAFQKFNEFHDGLQFPYDKNLIESYRKLVHKFIVVSTSSGPQARVQHDWGLQALASLSISAALSTSVGQEMLEEAIPTFYVSLPVDEQGAVFGRFNREFDSSEAHTISKMSENTHNLALWALRRSFDTSNGSLVVRITSRLLKCMETLDSRPQPWICGLFEAAAQWSQVQLRYKVVNTIIERMCCINVGSLEELSRYSNLLRSLLASASVSFVGLAVTDVLRDILKLQHRLVTTKFDSKLAKDATQLVAEVRKIIGSLGQHTVYAGQVSDMMAEILCRYSSTGGTSPTTASSIASDHRNPEVISNDMQNVRELLTTLPPTERLMVNLWGSTQWLLNLDEPQVLISYTLAFQEYLQRAHRVVRAQAHVESALGRQLASALLDSNNQATNFIAIYYCIAALVEHLDVNAVTISRWVYHVQEVGANTTSTAETSTVYTPLQSLSLLSVSQALLLAIFKISRREDAAQKCLEVIETRVQQMRWLPGIIYPTSVPADEAITVAVQHPPQAPTSVHDETDRSVFVAVEDLHLNEEEQAWISTPDEGLDDLAMPEDFNLYRKRAPSVAGSSHTDLMYSSVRSNHTCETGPTVSQLIRRASSSLSLQRGPTPRTSSPSMNGRPGMRAKMADILAELKLDSSSRGKLAV